MNVRVYDNVLADPHVYRQQALEEEFKSYDFGHCVFHGIALRVPSAEMLMFIRGRFPDLNPSLVFLRKSPQGQVEPHFIHTDIDMGDWSAILYLNPNPPAGDGTSFWTHRGTGEIASAVPHERSEDGRDPSKWELRKRVEAKFNRLVMFPSTYFHSRAIHENWGQGDDARLIQVAFGKGAY